ncbi:hypothetical protein JKF63_00619 [Porcisia hertigi]|uniref:Uncharacterized protein n=1 Tax=Porcisia hertigi TaxID=2761500 RepID=A0A836HDF3_9TRYP|nr:hypothetical protein JKF63_00619 [Porcisia hertigi]
MPTTSAPSPSLPALLPTSGTVETPRFAVAAAVEPTPSSDREGNEKMMEFQEEWHRLPSELSYLQTLIASLEAKQQQQQQPGPAASSLAAPTGGPSYTSQRGKADQERDDEERRVRELQLAVIERRRRRSRRRCDAVDEAFHKVMERRMRAMQHLAADPPAERLVGQGMSQYVPAALLPDYVVDIHGRRQPGPLPLVLQSAVESRMHPKCAAPAVMGVALASPAGVRALMGCPSGPAPEQDATVFLTQLDAEGKPVAKDAAARHSSNTNPSHPESQTETPADAEGKRENERASRSSAPAHATFTLHTDVSTDEDDDGGDQEAYMRPATLTEENRARWRELGYHVIVVGGKGHGGGADADEADAVRRVIQSAAASSNQGVGQWAAEPCASISLSSSRCKNPLNAQEAKRTGVPRWDWMQLAPLPPLCLVQRRLPEEDMSVAQLRRRHHHHCHQQSSSDVSSSISTSRWRQDRRGRVWRLSSKSAPH